MTVDSDMLQQLLNARADQICARIGADHATTQQAISAPFGSSAGSAGSAGSGSSGGLDDLLGGILGGGNQRR